MTEVPRKMPGISPACSGKPAGNGPAARGDNVVSLSGGLDSRAVAAGLRREEIPFTAATFLDSQQTNAADVRVASRVAAGVGSGVAAIPPAPPPGKRPGASSWI